MPTDTDHQDENNWMLNEVAYLLSQGLQGKEIASILNLKETIVSELKKKSLETDPPLLELPNYICNLSPDEQFRLEEQLLRPKRLQDRFELCGIPKHYVPRHMRIVYHHVPDVRDERNWEVAAQRFGRNVAASRLVGTMFGFPERSKKRTSSNCRTVGVCYSRVVRSFIDGLATRSPMPVGSNEVIVTPLWPEPLTMPMVSTPQFAGARLGATRMAADLDRILNFGQFESLSLQLMPAFRPRAGTPAHSDFLKAMPYLRRMTAFDLIFGVPAGEQQSQSKWDTSEGRPNDPRPVPPSLRPLVQNLDAILVGVGTKESTGNLWNGAFWNHGEIQVDELAGHVIGDVGGCFVPDFNRPGAEDTVKDFESRWNGIKAKHLKDCADRARTEEKRPGVIAFAIGCRGRILIEAMKLGWLNCVFMDQTCADDLESLLSASKPTG